MIWRRALAGLALVPALLLAGSAAAQQGKVIHTERSLYRNIFVEEFGDQRCMLFRARRGLGRESCMSLSDPKKLIFKYAEMMLGSLFLDPEPKHILIIGEGGGTLPSALHAMVPDADIDVVEIDAAVDRIARRYFNFATGPKVHVTISDGRVFVKRAGIQGKKYDLVMLDAFEADYIPEHMMTKEFLQEVKAIMTPHGVLAANTFSASALYDHESTTYQAVFGTFFNLKYANRIILTQLGGLPPMSTVKANAQRWRADFVARSADVDFVLDLFSTRPDWDRNARVLTDQYSPANVLNTLPRGY